MPPSPPLPPAVVAPPSQDFCALMPPGFPLIVGLPMQAFAPAFPAVPFSMGSADKRSPSAPVAPAPAAKLHRDSSAVAPSTIAPIDDPPGTVASADRATTFSTFVVPDPLDNVIAI